MPKYFLKHGITSSFREVGRDEYVREEHEAHRHGTSSAYAHRDDQEPVAPHFHGQRPNGRLGPVHVSGYVEEFIACARPQPVQVAPAPPVSFPEPAAPVFPRLVAA